MNDERSVAEQYEQDGFFVLPSAIPGEVVDSYLEMYQQNHGESLDGWGRGTKYLEHPEIIDVLCHQAIESAFEEIEMAAALHVEMTMQRSTQCGWHKDALLPDPHANSTYVGVIVALGELDDQSGPFELIVGSHKWEHISFDGENHKDAEDEIVNQRILVEIAEKKPKIYRFEGSKGDVVGWHSQTYHRGSRVRSNPHRPTLIGHYCGTYSHEFHRGPLPPYEVRKSEMESETMQDRYARHGRSGVLYFL